MVRRGSYIVELRPALRRLEWIDQDSPVLFGPDVGDTWSAAGHALHRPESALSTAGN